ncbi:histidine protein methyltransferase 1 homolog isoform X2 [Sitophilus oryzae]|uniref:protein-histidine N-methyltransferase n=1 Tax=Sitophilus oryzae TaxID=7048 RepID=A0A6J2YEE7_SITOR|nr:histidine protein methyltransferase 1 homolog isoform X2 [Sitophilus oryzae]
MCSSIPRQRRQNLIDVFNVLRTSDSDSTKDLSVLCADCNHSDLQAAVYEGGLKIWECTYDLVNYIAETELELEEKHVLDLGCGAGLIGLICLENGASCVFQDYNIEVLQYITIPNIILNNEEYVKKCRFYSGDWQYFSETIKDQKKFDYIFTSETIYNTENYSKLHDVFERLLNEDGEIYLAAKSHYFGVGGGITLFKEYISKRNIFQATSCWKHSEGVTREILRLQFLKHKKEDH